MATVPPYDIDLKGALRLVDIVKGTGDTDAILGIDGLFKRLWAYLDPENLPGAYSHLAERLDAYYTLIQSAGTGTALVMAGTEVERAALASPPDGLIWIVPGAEPKTYVYSATAAAWLWAGALVLGEDDFASNSASAVPTQQSTKKYIDDRSCEGLCIGFGHLKSGATSITLLGGRVETGGMVFSMGSSDTITTTMTGTRWCHLYLSDSLTNPATGLTAADFQFLTTEPTWSNAKAGWYYGDKRWIGAVHMTGGVIDDYRCYGGFYSFVSPLSFVSTGAPATTWTEQSTGLPNLGRAWSIDMMGEITASAANQRLRVRSADSGTTNVGMGVAATPAASVPEDGHTTVSTSNGGGIDYYAGSSATNVDLYLKRIALPGSCGGM